MARKRTYLRASQFQPHSEGAKAVERLCDARLCGFGVTPRGRIYGVHGGITDSHVSALLQLPYLIEVTVSNLANYPVFTDAGFEKLIVNSSIQIFGCAQNSALTDRSAEAVGSSNRIRWLGLNACAITDIGVHHISKQCRLYGLYLADSKLTDKCVPDICRLTALRNLNLRGTLVSESARNQLSAHLPKCRTMRLGSDADR